LVNYVALSFLDASLYATYPLLLALPIGSGGLNFSPKTIGYIVGAASLFHGLVQAVWCAKIIKQYNAKKVFVASIIAYVFLFVMMPFMNAVAQREGRVTPVVWSLLFLEEVAIFCSYSSYSQLNKYNFTNNAFLMSKYPRLGCMYIFISKAAPSQNALGKTHGLGQAVSAVVGAFAPAISTSLVAVSLQRNLLGGSLGYFLLAGVGVIELGLTSLLPI
jgi:hypothetical protein